MGDQTSNTTWPRLEPPPGGRVWRSLVRLTIQREPSGRVVVGPNTRLSRTQIIITAVLSAIIVAAGVALVLFVDYPALTAPILLFTLAFTVAGPFYSLHRAKAKGPILILHADDGTLTFPRANLTVATHDVRGFHLVRGWYLMAGGGSKQWFPAHQLFVEVSQDGDAAHLFVHESNHDLPDVVREFLTQELDKPLTPHRLGRDQAVEITGAGHGI